MDSGERALLARTVRDALAATEGPGDDIAVLTALGWSEMLAAEPDAAIAIVFTELGRSGARASVLDDVVLHALGISPRADLAVLLPRFGASAVAGDGEAAGLLSARAAVASELLVVWRRGAWMLPIGAAAVAPARGIDPEAQLHRVLVDGGRIRDAVAVDVAAGAWDGAVALARRALAHETAGACRTMLALAREHALARVQFGRPIARFQAVRHRLAESLVAVEALEATLLVAADEPGPETAALAKAAAGRTARTVGAHAQQVLAGIGFTTEHPFHRHLKRTIVLDGLFGSADTVTRELGRMLLASRRVPALVEL